MQNKYIIHVKYSKYSKSRHKMDLQINGKRVRDKTCYKHMKMTLNCGGRNHPCYQRCQYASAFPITFIHLSWNHQHKDARNHDACSSMQVLNMKLRSLHINFITFWLLKADKEVFWKGKMPRLLQWLNNASYVYAGHFRLCSFELALTKTEMSSGSATCTANSAAGIYQK